MDYQHNTVWKFARRWFGLYEVRQVRNNGTYHLSELEGALLRTCVARKQEKIFKKREKADSYMDQDEAEATEEAGISN